MARRPRLASMSIADLHAEIRRRERGSKALLRRRQNLLKKIAALDSEIAAAGGTVSGRAGGGRRPRNEMSLVEALKTVLKNKTLSVTDAAATVQRAGYQSSAKNFRVIVNAALIKKGNGFTKKGRGMYTAG